jgi:hypothetical membrane protein
LNFKKILKLSALCGLIAPAFFGTMVIIEQSIVPGYSWTTQHISDLGAYALYGNYAYLQNINFWVFGTLIVIFAIGMRSSPLGKKTIPVPLALFGIMVFLAGVFPDVPVSTGIVHGAVSIIAFLTIPVCQLLAWTKTLHMDTPNQDKPWVKYGIYSLVNGTLTFFLLFAQAGLPVGIGQRVLIAVAWLWIELTALKLLQFSNQNQKQNLYPIVNFDGSPIEQGSCQSPPFREKDGSPL